MLETTARDRRTESTKTVRVARSVLLLVRAHAPKSTILWTVPLNLSVTPSLDGWRGLYYTTCVTFSTYSLESVSDLSARGLFNRLVKEQGL